MTNCKKLVFSPCFSDNGLATMDTNEIDLTLKLNDLNPWYDGYARILVKYTSVGYKDYQLLKIPI